jgi:hypothetical protein
MNTLTPRFWITALFISTIPALALASTQTLNCRFPDSGDSDRIKITLNDSESGTFLYETPDPSSSGTTAPLKLKRIQSAAPLAFFEVQSSAVLMIFKIDSSHLFKDEEGINAVLSSQIPAMDLSQEQSLTCDSKTSTGP